MGMSLLAAKRLLERFGYSVVWCNVVGLLAIAMLKTWAKVFKIYLKFPKFGPIHCFEGLFHWNHHK